ncbi:MAG: type II secretion system protein [Acidobacteria bacterium]|nr:type II secretion system protein [Acidobacteriota bacterium]
MKNERGFSLVELLMVVVIMGVIMAFAVPGLRRARQNAQSGSAIQSMRTITTAQYLYERRFLTYGTLAQLSPEGTIDPALAAGLKSDYVFTMTVDAVNKKFSCTAAPLADPANMDYFFVDETGVIRFVKGAAADATSPPIPR